MSETTLYRAAALVALGTGALLVFGGIGLQLESSYAVPAFALAHFMLSLVIVAIYAPQVQESGWLGLAGFTLMLLGNMVFFSNQIGGLQRLGPFPTSTLLTLGVLVFAVGNTRAGVLPSYAAWLMFAGLFLNLLGGQLGWPDIVTSGAAPAANGLGVAWFGLGLLSLTGAVDYSEAQEAAPELGDMTSPLD